MGTFQYQGIAKRLIAQVIDLVLLYSIFTLTLVATLGLSFALKLSGVPLFYFLGGYSLVFALIFFLYFIVLESITGMTVGKRAVRIKVVREDGSKCGLMPAVIRNLLRIVDALPFLYILGMIIIARSDKKQRVGDIVAKTIVVPLESGSRFIYPQTAPLGEKKFCAYCGTELHSGASFCGNCGAKQ